MTLHDDNRVWTTVTAVAACLCAQVQDPDNGVPDVCFCGVVPGDAVVAQYAGDCNEACGMAWVRIANSYPAKVIGQPDVTAGNCGSGTGLELELGIFRCISVGDEQGNLPSGQELADAVQLQVADMLVMQKAVLCCDAIDWKSVILANYVPLGPQGGLVGGTVSISMVI